MIEKTFTVATADEQYVEFELPQQSACAGCNGRCGSQVFAKVFANKRARLTLVNHHALQVGQKVLLAFDDRDVIKMSFYTYILPIICALVSAILMSSLFDVHEIWHIMSAGVGALAGLFFAKNRLQSIKNTIQIKKIYPISIPVAQIIGD